MVRVVLIAPVVLCLLAAPTRAQDSPRTADVEKAVARGLEWLRKTQAADGHWAVRGGQYPTSMTALAGMCFLMEGSTLREGKYSDCLVKAVDWFLKRSQPNGLLGNPRNPSESSMYIHGHGFGLLFLASAYGEEDDLDRRKKLEVLIKKAVEFSGRAQTSKGGWGYVSARDGGDFDEGSTTVTQLQGLRAARNAGIPVPKEVIDRAIKYLHDCTTPRGGVIYRWTGGGGRAGSERPALTAAAIACAFSAGQYEDEYARKWIQFCKENIPLKGRSPHHEYLHYYYAQAIYVLGDDRYGKLFPRTEKSGWLTWSGYKEAVYSTLTGSQAADGSWTGSIGQVFCTAVNLTILQLDKSILPIYHR